MKPSPVPTVQHVPTAITALIVFCATIAFGGPYELRGSLSGNRTSLHGLLEAAEPIKSMDQLLNMDPQPQPEPNVYVTLRGQGELKLTMTDSKGDFKFSNLDSGQYELFAQKPIPSATTDAPRPAIAHTSVVLRHDKISYAGLRLETVFVNIKGRVEDADGKPVAGANITALYTSPHPVFQQYLENHEAPWWTTVSQKDGTYELVGLTPANIYHLAGFLVGKKACRSFVKIHVEAEGLVQKSAPEVPLITEELLGLSSRLLKIFQQMPEATEIHELREFNVLPTPPGSVTELWKTINTPHTALPVPTSEGNTITGMDFVLGKPSHPLNPPAH